MATSGGVRKETRGFVIVTTRTAIKIKKVFQQNLINFFSFMKLKTSVGHKQRQATRAVMPFMAENFKSPQNGFRKMNFAIFYHRRFGPRRQGTPPQDELEELCRDGLLRR